VNVLELCRVNSCSLTYISSYVYGAPQYLPVDEKHPISPASPYNHSKLVAEEICKYYARTFNFPVAVLRPINIYGPGQSKNFLIPTIIRQVLDHSREKIEVMDLRPKRDYLYIDDFVEALMVTMQIDGFEVFNLGSGYSVSVENLISVILQQANIKKPYFAKNIERKNEVWDVFSDISKIKHLLSWQPEVTLEKGISACIESYK
jgi:nucleoside-diphosphate-sugar epimerase